MSEQTMKKRFAVVLCAVTLAIPGTSLAQQNQDVATENASIVNSDGQSASINARAEDALDALENADEASLLTSEDVANALEKSQVLEPQEETQTKEAASHGEEDAKYLSEPPTAEDDKYLSAPPVDNAPDAETKMLSQKEQTAQWRMSQERKAQAIARSEETSWAGLVRMELGLGWGCAKSTYDGIYGAGESLYSFGPTGFLALKFRLSRHIPLQLGVDASFTYHPWARNPQSSAIYGGYNGARMGMGNVTLTAFMNDIFYLMLGLGIGGMQQDVDYPWTSDGNDSRSVRLGATGIAAAGVEFNLHRAFRLGLELRASVGVFDDRDTFGALSGYLVFSFF